jgi:DhnA family fructose-bisphosphate aldolase class Ia
LSDFGKRIRLNRILNRQGRGALVVAFDHALVLGPIPGTENPSVQIGRFVDAHVSAILLNLGLIQRCIDCFPPAATPGLIARIDWTNVWNSSSKGEPEILRTCNLAKPEEALRHGADAILSYLMVGTGDADFESKEIARNAKLARECEQCGMPLIVETLARGKKIENPGDPKWLALHTRIATELGADVIKTDYSGSVASMKRIVEGCLLPILVLGGNRHQGALEVVRNAMEAGAAGVFFGRNVFQSDNMEEFLREAKTILDGAEVPATRRE